MRLLIWHWGRRAAGPRLALELATALRERDADFRVTYSSQAELASKLNRAAPNPLVVSTFSGPVTASLGFARAPLLRRQLAGYIRAEGIDVVLSILEQVWQPLVAPAIHRTGASYLMAVHDPRLRIGHRWRPQDLLLGRDERLADGILLFSEAMRESYLEAHPGTSPSHVFSTVHPAFGRVAAAPRSLPVAPKLLFFGWLQPYKGLDLLLDAWPSILERCPSASLTIAGDGPMRHLSTDSPAGVTWDLRFIPEAEIDGMLRRHDALVLPYRDASQSGVVGLALANGLPVVATPVGGLEEQVRSSGCGVVSDAVSAPSFARAAADLLTQPQQYRACSEGGLLAARSSMSWRRVADDVMAAAKTLSGDA